MDDNDLAYANHILAAIEFIERHTAKLSYEEFVANELVFMAVIRQFEIIGEAAGQFSDKIQEGIPELPWRKIIGMRNKLIHEYFGVDSRIVWKAIRTELPRLKDAMKKLSVPSL